jgi:hypothetical protein
MEKNNKHPRSNRIYPTRPCLNKACSYGGKFTPHDKRQLYCCVQCRINASNDKRSALNNGKFVSEKLLRRYDQILSKLYKKYFKDDVCAVKLDIILHEEIDLRLLTSDALNANTNQRIRWMYDYGTERHPKDESFIIIYKR